MAKVIDRTIEPGYWVNLDNSSPYGFAGICVTAHKDGVITGQISTKGGGIVTIADDHPSIMCHTMPNMDAFERLSRDFRAGLLSRDEFVDAFNEYV